MIEMEDVIQIGNAFEIQNKITSVIQFGVLDMFVVILTSLASAPCFAVGNFP